MKRLALAILERSFGPQRASAILGDLEEDVAEGHARRFSGLWWLWQAALHVIAARYADRASRPSERVLGGVTMWHDVRYAIRSLRSAPTFSVVALIVQSLAIGASTAVFSVVDAVVLRSLPYDEPDRLVQVGTVDARTGVFETYQAPQTFSDWQSRQRVFTSMTATQLSGGFTINENGVPNDLSALEVTAGYFEVYRTHPQLGRAFTAEDERPGGEHVALISDSLWRRYFAGDPQVIGRTLESTFQSTYGMPLPVRAGTWTIVGVMPRGFRWPADGPGQTEVWVPYVTPENQLTRDGLRSAPLNVTGRLAEGVTVADADKHINAVSASLAEVYPQWFENTRGSVRSLHEATVGSVRAWMLMLLAAVGVVLLIACANIANLTLARATARGREIETRAALGASRWQIARGLLIESLVLSASGTLLGLVVAMWGIDALRAALPADLPRVSTVALNVRVLGAAALACLVTGVLFGLAPALRFSRSGASVTRRDGGRSVTAAATRLRSALVISEVALAVVLTIGAGLFLSSFLRVTTVDIGLNPRNVLTMRVWPKFDRSKPGWADPVAARSGTAIPQIVDRVAAIPGVEAVGFIAGDLPFSGYSARGVVKVPGRDQPFAADDRADVRHVTPGYANAVGTPLRRGRYLGSQDAAGSTPVVVINEEAASRYFAGRDPIGQTITIERLAKDVTVVGIVANVRLRGPERAPRPEAYLPVAQGSILGGALAVRTRGEPQGVAQAVHDAIRASLPEIPEPEAKTLSSLLGGLIAQRRFNMLIATLFGGLALAIGTVGLYGVMAYLVTQRTREIGVRLALGARPARVMREVVRRGAAHTAAGVAIGLFAAWQLTTWVQSLLFEVNAHDPVVYGVTAAILAACGIAAAFVPARRAARVDPVIALRAE